jgi:hypothetical protein
MRKLIVAAALIPALAGCETTHAPTVPTALESHADASVSAASSVQAQQTTFSFCPAVTPLTATIGVVVVAGNVNVLVTSITTQFTDVNSVQLPTITLPAPIPTAQIGSAFIQARSGVTFPVSVNFGCGTASTGTVAIGVHFQDANGVQSTRNLSVNVR